MMDPQTLNELVAALDGVARRYLKDHPELRAVLPPLAKYLSELASATAAPESAAGLEAAGRASAPLSPVKPPASYTVPAPAAPRAPVVNGPSRPLGIVALQIGDAKVHLPVPGTTAELGKARQSVMPPAPAHIAGPNVVHDVDEDFPWRGTAPPDLSLVARRCRLKAASCRTVLRRVELADDDPAMNPVLDLLNAQIAEAKSLPNCFLWAPYRQKPLPPLAVVSEAAEVYENLALAAELAERADTGQGLRRFLRDAMELLAEAQSALRIVLADTWLTSADFDQSDAFAWVRQRGESEGIFIERHMRLDDPADPSDYPALRAKLETLKARVDGAARQGKDLTAALNKLRYEARKLAGGSEPAETLPSLLAAAARLEDLGVDPFDKRVVEALGAARPMLAAMPEAGDFLTRAAGPRPSESEEEDDEPSQPRQYSPTVAKVRETLRGTSIVLVGGEVYPHAKRRLIEAFELADLEWCTQTEHGSSAPFESPIARPETRLVLVMVKLAGHQHIDDVRKWCRMYGKPLVMLTAGYNPEQVAAATLEQASRELEAA